MYQLDKRRDDNIVYLCREREEDYLAHLETARSGLIYMDEELRVRNMNREAERICGVDRALVLGRKASIVFRHMGEKFFRALNFSEYEDIYSANFRLVFKDRSIYLHMDTLKIRDISGDVKGVLFIMQDMSALRAAIKQIKTTELLVSMGELAAGVAHHIRTPLTTISGYLQLMLQRLGDEHYTVRREVLEMLLGEVAYINDVVKELVLFAKPPVRKKPCVNMQHVLEGAMRLTFRQLGGERIKIDRRMNTPLPLITADAELLQQVFVNIMANALEAMPNDGALSIETWLNADVHMLVVAVADTGCGVAPEQLGRVFEPFYTTKLERLGLGLPIAYRIVGEHGGFINMTSEPGRGTRVHVYLPLLDARRRHLSLVHQQVLNLQ